MADEKKALTQIDRNITAYAHVYQKCMEEAERMVPQSVDPQRLDRVLQTADTLFNRFFDDQIALKKENGMKSLFEDFSNLLEQAVMRR